MAWLVWSSFNESKNKEKDVNYNSNEIVINLDNREGENVKELNDGNIVPKIGMVEKFDKKQGSRPNTTESINTALNLPQIKDKDNKEEVNIPSVQMSPDYISAEAYAELEENVKLEVQRLLNNYYPPLLAKIDYLIQNGIYTKEWSDSLIQLHEKGIIECLSISYYEKKFPGVSQIDLFEIVGDVSQKFFKENLDDKFFGYIKRIEKDN